MAPGHTLVRSVDCRSCMGEEHLEVSTAWLVQEHLRSSQIECCSDSGAPLRNRICETRYGEVNTHLQHTATGSRLTWRFSLRRSGFGPVLAMASKISSSTC